MLCHVIFDKSAVIFGGNILERCNDGGQASLLIEFDSIVGLSKNLLKVVIIESSYFSFW